MRHLMQNIQEFSVCDIIVTICCQRFDFTDHLITATLFESDSFSRYERCFQSDVLKNAIESFPFLDGVKLKSELSVLYSRQEFHNCC